MPAAKFGLLAALGFLAPGCATFTVSEQIWPGEDKGFDYIAEVSAAYRDRAGEVLGCLEGKPAGSSWWFGQEAYSIAFPADLYEQRPTEAPELRIMYHEALPVFDLTAREVRGRCPKPGSAVQASLTPLPLETIRSDRFGSRAFSGMSEDKLRDFLDAQAHRPAFYVFLSRFLEGDDFDSIHLVYLHETPVFRGQRAVQIETGSRQVEGQPL